MVEEAIKKAMIRWERMAMADMEAMDLCCSINGGGIS